MSRLLALTAVAALLVPGLAAAQTPPPATGTPPPIPVPKPFPGAAAPPAGTSTKPTDPKAGDPKAGDPKTGRTSGSQTGAVQTTGAQTPAGAPAAAAAQTPPGVPAAPLVYPGADYLQAFDAGQGQRFYLFGTNLTYDEVVAYYRNYLRNNGDRISEDPNMQRFDLDRFDARTMAYPPSVVVKDYTWNGSEGYLFVDGTTPKRYRTIIQIVPGLAR